MTAHQIQISTGSKPVNQIAKDLADWMALKASPRQHLRQLQLQLLNVVDPSRITAIVGPIFSANLHVPVLFFIQENSLLGAAYQQISVLNTQFGPQTWKQQIHPSPWSWWPREGWHICTPSLPWLEQMLPASKQRKSSWRPWSIKQIQIQQPLNPSTNSTTVKAEVDGGGSVTPPWVDGNVGQC